MQAPLSFSLYIVLTAFLAVFSRSPFVNGIQLNELFRVKRGFDKGGVDAYFNILQSWLDDTETLVDFLLPQIPEDPTQVDGSDIYLKLDLLSFFKIRLKTWGGIHPDDIEAYTSLRDKVAKVDNFIKRYNSAFTDPKTIPWLMVNSDWLQETELYYDEFGNAIDTDGNVVSLGGPPQANLRTWSPVNVDRMDEDDQGIFADMKMKSGKSWKYYAYYSSDIHDYVMRVKKERYPRDGFCNAPDGEDFFALMIEDMYADSITICPLAFTERAELFETIVDSLTSDAVTKVGQPLEHTSPRGLTLFHELIHMTSGIDNTKDEGTRPTECLQLIKDGRYDEARSNPDSIVFFAWAYYLSWNVPTQYQYRWNTGKSVKAIN